MGMEDFKVNKEFEKDHEGKVNKGVKEQQKIPGYHKAITYTIVLTVC